MIGFLNRSTCYNVSENDGQVNIHIQEFQGFLQGPVAVQVSTSAISAAGWPNYIVI